PANVGVGVPVGDVGFAFADPEPAATGPPPASTLLSRFGPPSSARAAAVAPASSGVDFAAKTTTATIPMTRIRPTTPPMRRIQRSGDPDFWGGPGAPAACMPSPEPRGALH